MVDDELSIKHSEQRGMTPWSTRARLAWWEGASLALALGVFLLITVSLIYQSSPLGHDESLYSARARELLRGEPPSSWWLPHRAPGLPMILTLAWIGNGTDPYLRMVVVMSGVVLIVTTWLLGRLIVGRAASVVASLGVALSPVILMSASQVWPDVPGAAAGMAAMCVYGYWLVSDRMRWSGILLVTGLVAFGITIRYGAPIPICVGLVGITFRAWPSERQKKIRVAAAAVAVAIVGALLLLTPLLSSDTPFDALAARSGNNPLFAGFGDYWELRDQVFSVSMILSMSGLLLGGLGSTADPWIRKAFTIPFAIFVLTAGAIATLVHGEVRYLSPAIPWLWLAAGAGFVWLFSEVPRLVSTTAGLLAVCLLAIVGWGPAAHTMDFNEGFVNIERAAVSLRGEGECGVFTSYTPQVEWYSECESAGINRSEVDLEFTSLPTQTPLYFFIVENGKRQPDGDLLEQYLRETTGVPVTFDDPEDHRYVEIWRFRD